MEISEIKSRLTLAEIIKHYGLKADKQNRVNCPFHDDKTPSMQLYYKTHTCYCFSSNCKTHGKSMDVIDFVMHKEQISKRQAILKCVELITGTASPATQLTRTATLTKMFIYFKNGVYNSKPAKDYIQSRNLDYTKLEIGYNSGQFHHGTRKDEQLIKQCLEYGLLLDKGLVSRTGAKAYVPFGKNGIVFALRNAQGNITGLYFRSTLNDKDQRHFYLKDRSGLYPHYPKPETEKLILTESIIDTASLQQSEEITKAYSLLALYGTNGLTQEHIKAIKNLKKLKEIIFFLNGDQPGKEAVKKYAPLFKTELPGITITNIEPPEGEDVNSLLQSHEPEILLHLVEQRKPFISETLITETLATEEEKQTYPLAEIPQAPEKPEKSELPKLKTDPFDTTNPQCIRYTGQAAKYSIRGANKPQLDSLKISLQIIHPETEQDYRTKLDLYEYKQVNSTAQAAAKHLALRNDLIEKDLTGLTGLIENWKEQNQENGQSEIKPKIRVPEGLVQKCTGFMKQKNYLLKLNELIEKAGITGEEKNRLLLFLIASSYKMPDTLHASIQGSSGSGKTRLLQVISLLMPQEDVKRYTRVTDGSFYNQDEYFFTHKLICFEDIDGLKEEALLAVRELQSNGILITSTSFKDENGQIRGGERIVKGPIASLACTTKGELYEDNQSRVFAIAVDEGEEQTQRIISHQNRKAAGLIDQSQEQETREFIQHCIRLLKPYQVINPYAHKITLPRKAHKIRRLNELFQCCVKQITLLNQYQRKKDKENRLISEKEDIALAIKIMFESIVLKVDELDGSIRQFFEKLKAWIEKEKKEREYEFTRFEIREATGVSKTQQHHYISRLTELEYLIQYGFANRGYKYKIAYWDNAAAIRAQIKDDLERQLQEL